MPRATSTNTSSTKAPRRRRTSPAKSVASTSIPLTAEATQRRMKSPAFVLAVVALGIIVVGGAVFLGRSDNGQIDVVAAVQKAGTITDENGTVIDSTVAPAAYQNMPNGGLVPQDGNAQPAPPAPTEATTTATSTDEGTATTTSETPTETEQSTSSPESAS